ncbi:unnamed protein product [Fraxinus pennsylvanica]|uniref:Uncharacterized protein n=1 Tax=Fraxinus pennsylvanica TaxID=56036 RepID=A0AAD2A605_9LAMI|nr:unnamed protein product [Fraxinus pennsylvanica]
MNFPHLVFSIFAIEHFSLIDHIYDLAAGTPNENGVFRMRCLLIEPFPESALNEKAGKMLLENYEYARHARLHALKQKLKFKTGVISESTITRNVDQTNSSVKSADQKNAVPGPTSSLASKLENSRDQPAVITSTTETGVGRSMTAPLTQKKEVRLSKAPTDKRRWMQERKA